MSAKLLIFVLLGATVVCAQNSSDNEQIDDEIRGLRDFSQDFMDTLKQKIDDLILKGKTKYEEYKEMYERVREQINEESKDLREQLLARLEEAKKDGNEKYEKLKEFYEQEEKKLGGKLSELAQKIQANVKNA